MRVNFKGKLPVTSSVTLIFHLSVFLETILQIFSMSVDCIFFLKTVAHFFGKRTGILLYFETKECCDTLIHAVAILVESH